MVSFAVDLRGAVLCWGGGTGCVRPRNFLGGVGAAGGVVGVLGPSSRTGATGEFFFFAVLSCFL